MKVLDVWIQAFPTKVFYMQTFNYAMKLFINEKFQLSIKIF